MARKNFAYSTVATAPSPATSGTSLVVQTGDGANFPAPATDGPFYATIWPSGVQPSVSNAEIVKVTARSGDTFTIARAKEGTTAQSITTGFQIAETITVQTLKDMIGNKVNVREYGAVGDVTTVGTGGTDDTAAFAAALAALPTVNGNPAGTVLVPASVYRIDGDIGNIGPYVSIIGEGKWASILDYRGSGDCIRVADLSGAPTSPGWLNGKKAGDLRDFCIDGTSAGSAAVGLHYGDINGGGIDILVQNFTGATAQGILFENAVWWTERVKCKALLRNNTFAVTFQIATGGASTATGSFGHGDYDFQLYGLADQRGVRILAGAHVAYGSLKINGATTKGTLSALGVLTVSGTGPAGTAGAGGYSLLYNEHLDINVEHQADVAHGGTTLQHTIELGDTTNNQIIDCYGSLNFQDYDVSNVDLSTGAFRFSGVIVGDPTLGKAELTKLFDKTLSADATTVDTGAILPSGYSALLVEILARTDDAGASVGMFIRVNNDSGNNYDNQFVQGANATPTAGAAAAVAQWAFNIHGSGGSASYPGVARLTIPGYDQTTFFKVAEMTSGAVDATAANNVARTNVLGWRSTAAINRLAFAVSSGGKFKAGSRFLVYGLP